MDHGDGFGDPNFVPELNTLIRDEYPQVRGMALLLLIEDRRIESKTAQAIAARAMEAAKAAPEMVAEKLAKASDALGVAVIPANQLHLDGGSYAMGSRD